MTRTIGLRTAAVCALILTCQQTPSSAAQYTGRAHRDPFDETTSVSSVKDEIGAMGLTLEGVVWNTAEPRAIVSGKIVKIGGRLNGIEILDISREGVKMRYKGQEFYLRKRKIKS
ncbi:MAG: hypothetical protein MOGMAGMI_00978 [Candidatus Omnitrophica bacterium]|nr:hypothetical protein [Candidatus Omnitrophota bacterium]